MNEYYSSHTKEEVENTINKILNKECSVQGVKVFGNELPVDYDGKVDVTLESLTSQGIWTPYLGANNSRDEYIQPTVDYSYRYGYYLKFGKLCYISFKIKCRITSLGDPTTENWAFIGDLPATSVYTEGNEWAISVNEFYQDNGNSYIPYVNDSTTINFWINPNKNEIRLEMGNGLVAIQLGASNDPNQNLYISGSGFYPFLN